MVFPIYPSNLPYVSTEQMIEVDRAMMEDMHSAFALEVGPLFAESELLPLR